MEYPKCPGSEVGNPSFVSPRGFFSKSIPKRYLVTLMCFFGQIVITLQRVNMVVSIVAMVNRTAIYEDKVLSEDCPKGSKASTMPEFQGEFLWNPPVQGLVIGAFGYGQVTGQLFCGRLAERFGGKRVMGFSLLASSLITFTNPLTAAWNVHVLIVLRMVIGTLLGSGSSVTPFMIGRWIPKSERSVHSSLAMSGTAFGPALGVVLSGLMCNTSFLGGWPLTFYSFGTVGCIWFLFWWFFIHEVPQEHPSISDEELMYILANIGNGGDKKCFAIPWSKMLSSVPFWALLLAHFGQFWAVAFFNTVHVMYMGNVINLPIKENGELSSLPHLLKGLVACICSYPADWLIKKRYANSTIVRKSYVFISSVAFSLCFLALTFVGCNHLLNASLFVIAFAMNALMIPGTVVSCIELAPDFRGTVTGIVFSCGTTSSFIIPALVGSLTTDEQSLTQWSYVFYISSGISMGTAVFFALFGSAESQPWGVISSEVCLEDPKKHPENSQSKAKASISHNSGNPVLLKITNIKS